MTALADHARAMRDHRYTKRHASGYLDGELPEPGRHRVERHTQICPQCRHMVETLKRTVGAVRGLRERPRPGLSERVIARLRDQDQSVRP